MGADQHGSPVVASWLEGFVEAALAPDEVDAFVREVDAEIIAAIPEIAGDPVLTDELHASTREHWRNFLVGLSDDYRLALPPAAIALSQSIARRQLDISVLLKVYRVANKSVFRYVAAHTERDVLPPDLPRDEALLALWLRAERWIDESIEQLIDQYTAERAKLAEGFHARRAEAIESLLAGARPGAAAERVLGHRLNLWQTAFVVAAPPTSDGDHPLYDVAARACQLLGLPTPLTTLAGSRELWGWVATPESPLMLTSDSVRELVGDAGLHLAIGRPCRGADGFRLSHLQALAAHRTGLRTTEPCHAYEDVEIVCLVGDGELQRDMVARTLRPLLGDQRTAGTLRSTVLAFLRSGLSVDEAAAALFVHPNTVRYRIARAEEKLGYRLASNAATLELCLAWVDVHGERALT